MKRAATALALWLCWLSAADTDAQQRSTRGRPPRKAVVIGQVEPALLERVRGQTGDLSWDLRLEETSGQPDLEQARAAAERHGAEAVIWFEAPAGGGLVVNVMEIEQSRLLSRNIEPPGKGEVHAYSATAEAAALVVRSSLMSLASGAPLGEPVEGRPADRQTAAEEEVESETQSVEAGTRVKATTGPRTTTYGQTVQTRARGEKSEEQSEEEEEREREERRLEPRKRKRTVRKKNRSNTRCRAMKMKTRTRKAR